MLQLYHNTQCHFNSLCRFLRAFFGVPGLRFGRLHAFCEILRHFRRQAVGVRHELLGIKPLYGADLQGHRAFVAYRPEAFNEVSR